MGSDPEGGTTITWTSASAGWSAPLGLGFSQQSGLHVEPKPKKLLAPQPPEVVSEQAPVLMLQQAPIGERSPGPCQALRTLKGAEAPLWMALTQDAAGNAVAGSLVSGTSRRFEHSEDDGGLFDDVAAACCARADAILCPLTVSLQHSPFASSSSGAC